MSYTPLNLATGTLVTAAHLAYIETQYSSVFDSSDKTPAGNFYWSSGKNFGWSDGYWTRVGANSAKFWNGSALGTVTASVAVLDSVSASNNFALTAAASTSIPLVGFYHDTETTAFDFATNTTHQTRLDSSGNWTHKPGTTIGWGTSTPRSSQDLYFSRVAAGIAGIFNDSTHGVSLKVTTDGTLWVLNRDGSSDNATFKTNHILATGDLAVAAATKLYLDGGGNTYIIEDSADVMGFWAGGTEMFRINRPGVIIDVLNSNLGIGPATKFYLDGGSDTYLWEGAANDARLVVGGVTLGQWTLATYYSASTSISYDPNAKNGINLTPTTNVTNQGYIVFRDASTANIGSVTQDAGSSVSYNTISDARLKTDLGIVTDHSVLSKTIIHDFSWKKNGHVSRGVFAQEAWNINPRAVTPGSEELDADGFPTSPWSVDYSKYVPDLIVGWQSHEAEIVSLKRRIAQLEGSVH